MTAYRPASVPVNTVLSPPSEISKKRPPIAGVYVGRVFVPGKSGKPTGDNRAKARIGGDMKKSEAFRALKPGPRVVLDALFEAAGGMLAAQDGELFLACKLTYQGTTRPDGSKTLGLCDRTGLSERQIRRHIKTLREAGFISVAPGRYANGYNVFPFVGEETPDRIDASELGEVDRVGDDSETGRECPVSAPTPGANVRSDRAQASAHTGRECPVSAVENVRSSYHHQISPPDITTTQQHQAASEADQPSEDSALVVVVVDLLKSRGMTEKTAETIAASRGLADVVRGIAALDAGELHTVGGLAKALIEGWGTVTKPAVAAIAPTREDREKAQAWWVSEKSAKARASAVAALWQDHAEYRLSRANIEAPTEMAVVTAARLCNARAWWSRLSEPQRAAWRGVALCLRPEWADADPNYLPMILLARSVQAGTVKLGGKLSIGIDRNLDRIRECRTLGIKPTKAQLHEVGTAGDGSWLDNLDGGADPSFAAKYNPDEPPPF